MQIALSARLAAVVDRLPITPGSRILEIGCGPGAAARAVAERLDTGFVLAVDRSSTAIGRLRTTGASLIAAGRLGTRTVPIEDFVPEPGEPAFDFAFANRVGAFDGRHPEIETAALQAVSRALVEGGALYVDGRRHPRI
ncbi:methyltransferase family protein [Pseudonocardia sediminis]|uniref:Methyltransferase family protein n=1 Tax=Pseudonocardia sediminis TaxID=1397368 RepID=A0A4Q7UZT7_PSEST|nr:class I SAM-dependent methyltransferase [Pseudonocardia sediminis]RZT85719.1 methyltransferase family protein [Pseudonocardia sediminis]